MNILFIFFIVWIVLGFNKPLLAESLWLKSTTSEKGIFADRKAYQVGDILTLSINFPKASNQGSFSITRKGSKKTSTFDNPAYRYLLTKAAKNIGVGVSQDDMKSTSDHDGTDLASIDDITMMTTFSVMIIDTLPNKNLVIEGARRLKMLDEIVLTTVRGIVRVDDINKNNIIDATKVADLHVDMLVEGSVNNTSKKGIIMQTNDALNIF